MIAILVLKQIPRTIFNSVINNKLLTIALILQIALLFLIMLVRPFNIGSCYLGRISGIRDELAAKYLIFVTPMAVIFWYMVLAKLKDNKIYLIYFFLLIVITNYNRMILPTFYNTLSIDGPTTKNCYNTVRIDPTTKSWYKNYQNIDNGISIEIAPTGWIIPSSSQNLNLHSK